VAGHIAVVGGGLCGLTAALYLARAGKSITLFEKRRFVGGRARTEQHQGFRFNLGPHALYRRGAASRVLAELGIPIDGGVAHPHGLAIHHGKALRFPGDPFSLLTTSLLSVRGKLEMAAFLARIKLLQPELWSHVPVSQWLDDGVQNETVRQLMEALVRLTTYANAPAELSAGVAIAQLRQVLEGGVLYLHEGWQRLVDAVHSAAVSAGVNFVTSSRVVRVVHDGEVRGVELGELEDADLESSAEEQSTRAARGTSVHADVVVLAVDPGGAAALVQGDSAPGQRRWTEEMPVRVASLDLALSALPQPRKLFALGIDQPTYFSVHSAWAHLAPKGSALIHIVKYLRDGEAGDAEKELEQLADRLQPGWRDRIVHRRFLPRLTVSNALPRASQGGFSGRPDVEVPGIRNLYLAGDWVGPEGLLSDASLASARRAAKRILTA
jgi:phytoene dehydrogenase-like protein